MKAKAGKGIATRGSESDSPTSSGIFEHSSGDEKKNMGSVQAVPARTVSE